MPFTLSAVLARNLAAVSLAVIQWYDWTNEDKPLRDGIGAPTYPDIQDVLTEVLSFLPPFEWAGLRRVNSDFYACLRTTIGLHFEQHGVPLDPTVGFKAMVCSEERKMEDVLKSVMDQPGFRGAIFNKDECTLINHSLRGSQVCSEKGFDGRVRITGVAHFMKCVSDDQSKCNDYFLHQTGRDQRPTLHARNIRTGQDIFVGSLHYSAKAILANEKQLVIVQPGQVLMYELDWDANTAECILRERKKGICPVSSIVLLDKLDSVSSILCHSLDNYLEFDIESKVWKMIPETDHWRTKISPDGKIIFNSEKGISIGTTDGETTFLKIPGDSNFFHPSPDGKFVVFRMSSKICIMNLRSSEITVIPDIDSHHSLDWTSGNLFRFKHKDGRYVLRCAHNPSVDVVTLNEDCSLIEPVMVNDEVDAGDLFYWFRRIGPNLYYSVDCYKVIQVQWLNTHKH